jgi:hypothetical protein
MADADGGFMTNVARDQHRRLDRAYAEVEARDGSDDGQADIARPRIWRRDSTVSGGQREPRVLLVKLTQKMSAKGTVYLSGWMGAARLVGFVDKEPDKDGNQVWNIFAAEPGKRP